VKVLIAEDDGNIRRGLGEILSGEGYTVVDAADGPSALQAFKDHRPDFVCLDVMMPGASGYDVCRELRRLDPEVPIVFISAKSEEIDRVVGLELGADDFIVKPFGVREVVARIRAVSRRCLRAKRPQAGFVMHDLEVLPSELRARRKDSTIDLSLRDAQVLSLLYERRGEAVGRDTFFDHCWGLDHVPNSRTLDQHIAQLRKRIEVDPKTPRIIRTVHGVGYRFDP
jgi:two-component system, OmpR family, alkaline phosphatase synthesis response regulator PhoP